MTASLLEQLNAAFAAEPLIDELGVIFPVKQPPQDSQESAADVGNAGDPDDGWILVHGRKLGLSVHHLKRLCREARAVFWECVAAYIGGDDNLADKVLASSRGILLVNADHATAWDLRKMAVLRGHSSPQAELRLLDLVFCKHSKSSHAWAHRRWCWSCALRDSRTASFIDDSDSCSDESANHGLTLQRELDACARIAELYPKNYYAWSQRAWALRRCLGRHCHSAAATDAHSSADSGRVTDRVQQVLQRELAFTHAWASAHVSDHSALHHRACVVRLALAHKAATAAADAAPDAAAGHEQYAVVVDLSATHLRPPGAVLNLLRREFEVSSALLTHYPGHESLWCYRRFVLQALVEVWNGARAGIAAAPHAVASVTAAASGVPIDLGNALEGDWLAWAQQLHRYADGGSSSGSDDGCSSCSEAARGASQGDGASSSAGDWSFQQAVTADIDFAFRCANDASAWAYEQQRVHALTYVRFATWCVARYFTRGSTGDSPCPYASEDEHCAPELVVPPPQQDDSEGRVPDCEAYRAMVDVSELAAALLHDDRREALEGRSGNATESPAVLPAGVPYPIVQAPSVLATQ